jgi:hypothetical protein
MRFREMFTSCLQAERQIKTAADFFRNRLIRLVAGARFELATFGL